MSGHGSIGETKKKRNSPFAVVEGGGEDIPEISSIPISSIDVKENPRTKDNEGFSREAIAELAESIKSIGLIQPITVRKKGNRYELIAGERRLRATKHLKRKNIHAVILDVEALDPELHSEARLSENLQRSDLTSSEIALAVYSIAEKKGKSEAARLLGKSPTWVTQRFAHGKMIQDGIDGAEKIDSTTAYNLTRKSRGSGEEVNTLVSKAIESGNPRDFSMLKSGPGSEPEAGTKKTGEAEEFSMLNSSPDREEKGPDKTGSPAEAKTTKPKALWRELKKQVETMEPESRERLVRDILETAKKWEKQDKRGE